jgi:hypothetical protein
MIRSFPPHPNPLPPGERVGHLSPQQSWGVFWHILINLCTPHPSLPSRGEGKGEDAKCWKKILRFNHIGIQSPKDVDCLEFWSLSNCLLVLINSLIIITTLFYKIPPYLPFPKGGKTPLFGK